MVHRAAPGEGFVDATYVLYVPRKERSRIHGKLTPEVVGDVRWRERKIWRGSEFYFSGPAASARAAHTAAMQLLFGF